MNGAIICISLTGATTLIPILNLTPDDPNEIHLTLSDPHDANLLRKCSNEISNAHVILCVKVSTCKRFKSSAALMWKIYLCNRISQLQKIYPSVNRFTLIEKNLQNQEFPHLH